MSLDGVWTRLRGVLGTATVWGAGWAALGFVVYMVLWVAGVVPEGMAWYDGLMVALRFGVAGGAAGVAFAGAVGLLFRGRRLAELSWVRFGIGGAFLAGVFLPMFLQLMNVISGDGMVGWEHVLDDGLWAALFGGIAAGGTLKIAQRADRSLPPGTVDDEHRVGVAANGVLGGGGKDTP